MIAHGLDENGSGQRSVPRSKSGDADGTDKSKTEGGTDDLDEKFEKAQKRQSMREDTNAAKREADATMNESVGKVKRELSKTQALEKIRGQVMDRKHEFFVKGLWVPMKERPEISRLTQLEGMLIACNRI